MTTPRKIRARGALPANWKFRDGRPRWEPGPGLRASGWRGRDLKGPDGFLTEGASIDMARSINEAVAAWRAGDLVPADYADIAPPGACATASLTRAQLLDRRAIGRLLDAYLASREFKGMQVKRDGRTIIEGGLAPATQREYASKLSRLVDVLAGYAVQLPRDAKPADRQLYEARRAGVRSMSIDVLEPPAFGSADKPLLYTAYWKMREHAGHHMANGTLRVASAWLDWCLRIENAVRLNAAKLVDMQEAPGRLRVATWEELQAYVTAADRLGYPSIGDSVILGVDLSWNQGDRLALTWDKISAEHRVRGVRRKTGRAGETQLLPTLGIPRLQAIRERQAAILGPGASYTHVLVCETTGAPWAADHYRHTFREEVRAEAIKICPSCATLNDQDLRDTAVTIAYEAGLTEPEIASRTLHSLKRIREILDAHYGEISRQVGDNGAAKLTAYLASKGRAL